MAPQDRNCHFYVAKGWCRYGDGCKFQHPADETRREPRLGDRASTRRAAPPPPPPRSSSNAGLPRSPGASRPSAGPNILLCYARGSMSLAGDQFNMARLVSEAHRRLGDDPSDVLQLLGGPSSHCLQAIEEICRSDFTVWAGNNRVLVSFQRVVVPLLRLVTDRRFLNSPLGQLSNPVLARIADTLCLGRASDCLLQLASAGSITDADPRHKAGERELSRWAPGDYAELAQPIADFVYEALLKFQDKRACLAPAAATLADSLEAFLSSLEQHSSRAPLHTAVQKRVADIRRVLGEHERLRQHLVDLESRRERRKRDAAARERLFGRQEEKAGLEGPGELREGGPRHSNDHADIRAISTMPTSDEVLCTLPPYLPKGPSWHLPPGSAEAHIDRQYRLMRHDILAELCGGVAAYQASLARSSAAAPPGRRHQQGGLLAAAAATQQDVRVFDYKNVVVEDVHLNKWAGAHFVVSFDDVKRDATPQQRREFWTKTKRLQHGTLICLVVPPAARAEGAGEELLVFGTVSQRDIEELAPSRPQPGFRPSVGIRLGSGATHVDDLKEMMHLLVASARQRGSRAQGQWRHAGTRATLSSVVMLQSGGSYFAYEPILKALQGMECLPMQELLLPPPTQAPGQAIAHVQPPAFLGGDSHAYDLRMLASADRVELLAAHRSVALMDQLAAVDLLDPAAFPVGALTELTTLDPGQITALKACLSQQLALVQGPPGTGKTHLALQLMRVLLGNLDAGQLPVLCVCYTNHALDQFLEGILQLELIKDPNEMVRIGSKSKSQILERHNLKEIIKSSGKLQSEGRLKAECYGTMEVCERDCQEIVQELKEAGDWLPWKHAADLVEGTAPRVFDSLAGDGGRVHPSTWGTWANGRDLRQHGRQSSPPGQAGTHHEQHAGLAKARLGFSVLQDEGDEEAADAGSSSDDSDTSTVDAADLLMADADDASSDGMDLDGDDSIAVLLASQDAWALTLQQRQRLVAHWRLAWQQGLLHDLHRHMEAYSRCRERLGRVHDASNLRVLNNAKVVGATTSGVAMNQSLIAALGPKIVICEEAAEVLEAHVLASLTRHTEQLILIGDHEQLRPKVQTYLLSMDSNFGYNLDLSLFERLVRQGRVPVRTLEQQRRMRPAVSRLIRATIYPSLKDHPDVLRYGAVRGMQHPMFWITHAQPEGGDRDDLASKYNLFEAEMATRLARYLVQNGYGGGKITILTPYVGQLLLLRREAARHFCITLDERDAQDLADMEEGDAAELAGAGREMSMKDAVRLATIDNYQGEENEIIILSLVRSNKDKQVGFVRLQNRTNVMLSRAKQGLYIIGNADCMASGRHPGIWPRVVSMFEEDDLLGPAFHLVCQKHPLDVTAVSTPRDFDTRVSDGGCSRNCTERLQPCGHACPRLCHSDDPLHRLTKCHKPCNKPQPCGHPCRYKCYEKCGSCTVLLRDVPLPCGHVMPSLECWRARQVEAVRCERPVEVCMPHCGHVIAVPCADAQAAQNKPWMCSHACNALLPCEHPCTSSCGRCLEGWAAHELGFRSPAVPASLETEQRGSTLTVRLPSGDRVLRLPPPAEWLHRKCTGACGRTLFCGHRCEGRCHQGSECPPCRKPCGVQCMHSKCGKACGDLCPPCAEPCPWDCPHQGLCPLPCGAPCVRLPCDKRCSRRLACGCLCPSVCGEPCPDPRFCPNHGLPDIMVYDPIMCEERCVVELGQEELDADPLICLPCGHAFPVSSMDEQMELQAKKRSLEGGGEEVRGAYTRRPDGSWAAPFPLQESLSQASTCMKCRAPVGGVRRYGRLLGKQGVDAAEIKFLKQSSVALEGLGRRLDGLSRSAAAAAASEGGGGGERQRQLHGLQKDGRELLERCKALVKEVSQPPTILLYDAARATVLRLAEEQRLPQGRTEEALRHLVMPRPDVTPALRAVLMRTRCCVELLQLGAAELEALKAELVRAGKAPARPMGPQAGRGGSRQGSSRPAEQRVSELAGSLTRLFSGGLKGAEYAQQLAEERGSFRYQVACCRALAQLLMARAMALAALDSTAMAEALRKEPSAHRSATQQAKHVTLDKAEEVLADAQRLVRTHPAAAEDPDQMAEQMEGLSGLLRRVRQLRDTGELSEEDKALIVRAMVQADPSLANPGLNRTGHFNRCSCGFIYVIGECGGAMQAMRCPECRRTIGGANHNLQEGNAPAIDFFQLAQQQQRNM